MMQYKTMVLGLLEARPALYRHLCMTGTALQTLEQYATALKACHLHWIDQLRKKSPDNGQIESRALELALQELRESLPPESEENETLTLGAAMAFIQRHAPPT
jgi:hypothetical protein